MEHPRDAHPKLDLRRLGAARAHIFWLDEEGDDVLHQRAVLAYVLFEAVG
jgi:hypothetical protein